MIVRNARRAFVALVAASAAAACGSAVGAGGAGPDQPQPASEAEFEDLYRVRMESELTRFTGADVDFMTGMIVHHAQALVMSRLAPTNAASSSVQTLAARIINAQRDEIATMQKWLGDRGETVPEVEIDGLNLTVPGAEHHMNMPGMLTQAQLEELAGARGAEFDRLFLTYMIQHHQGAVTMVHDLFATDGAAQDEVVFRFASDVQVDQITEVNRMERMLSAMAAGDAR